MASKPKCFKTERKLLASEGDGATKTYNNGLFPTLRF
jgi:hypothetical protein